jgi:hypothetical protein
MTIHLLTGEYGPDAGGVGAYSHVLVEALRRRGVHVRVWNAADPALRQGLPAALKVDSGFVLLQYVPNALGARGANVAFCQWLLSLRRDGMDVRVMFHEPYFYLSWNPKLNALAMVQRLMAALLLRASSQTYIATDQWRGYLTPYAESGTDFTLLPIPSTLPADPPPEAIVAWRRRLAANGDALVAHFGTYGDHVATELAPMVPALLQRVGNVRFVFVGRGGERFAEQLVQEHPTVAARVHATGPLDGIQAACAIAACDVALQPYPDGVTTRRTSVMAPLALGVPTVTSDGRLTEAVWRDMPSVALAPASDTSAHVTAAASLLRDEDSRRRFSTAGRRLYADRFAIECTVDALIGDTAAVQ